MGHLETLRIDHDDRGVARVTMSRPEVRNAFNDRLIGELQDAAAGLGADDGVRAVVLTGAGEVFSAGADLNWMRSMKQAGFDDNVADAQRLERMLGTLWDLPKPLVARVNGHAFGGGIGLVAVCDVAVALAQASFGFTEVRLGIVPAVISPYVVRKVGRSFARAAFVTGERFDAARALAAGLVHEVVADTDALDAAIEAVLERCLEGGPQALAAAKRLPEVAAQPLDVAAAEVVRIIAELRVSEEGQEGMAAFLEKRAPAWTLPGAPQASPGGRATDREGAAPQASPGGRATDREG